MSTRFARVVVIAASAVVLTACPTTAAGNPGPDQVNSTGGPTSKASPTSEDPPGGAVRAGRGGKDEDTEHERKVLIESDAEYAFGSDVLTAPQVIGDDEFED